MLSAQGLGNKNYPQYYGQFARPLVGLQVKHHFFWFSVLKPCFLRSTRVETFKDSNQEQLRADDINLLEEKRNQALIRSAVYQQALRKYYDRKVQPRSLAVGDLVLRLCQNKSNRNKLSPKWEGPYTVVEVTRPGSVRLAMEDG